MLITHTNFTTICPNNIKFDSNKWKYTKDEKGEMIIVGSITCCECPFFNDDLDCITVMCDYTT